MFERIRALFRKRTAAEKAYRKFLSGLGIKNFVRSLAESHEMEHHGLVYYHPGMRWLFITKDRGPCVTGSPIDTRIELLYRNDKIVGVKLYVTPTLVGHPL
jgi:hypothetical protein